MSIKVLGQLTHNALVALLALLLFGACSSAEQVKESNSMSSTSLASALTPSVASSQESSEESAPDKPDAAEDGTERPQVSCGFNEQEEMIRCSAIGIPEDSDYFWDSTIPGNSDSLLYEINLSGAGPRRQSVEVILRVCEQGNCTDLVVSVDLRTQDAGSGESDNPDRSDGNSKNQPEGATRQADADLNNCPTDFKGWLSTFPLNDYQVVKEVGPPGRIDPDDLRGHGYFRVPEGMNGLEVRMPVDGILYTGSNHLSRAFDGSTLELQYRLEFQTKCEGIRFRFDHIREPVGAIAELFKREPREDSRGVSLEPMAFREGDLIATKIGFEVDGNAFLDFGIYDDLKRVSTSQDPRFQNAVCFYDFFPSEIASYLRGRVQRTDNLDPDICP